MEHRANVTAFVIVVEHRFFIGAFESANGASAALSFKELCAVWFDLCGFQLYGHAVFTWPGLDLRVLIEASFHQGVLACEQPIHASIVWQVIVHDVDGFI